MKYYIGIDIGLRGGMSLMAEDKNLIQCIPIPTIEVLVGKKIRNQYDINSVNYVLKQWAHEYDIAVAGAERLRAIPHQSSQVAFSMGGGAMLFKALFATLGIRAVEFEPRSWQQKVFKSLGIQYTGKTTKQASIQAAKKLWPDRNFMATARSRVPSDGLTDSACIALYTKINDIL